MNEWGNSFASISKKKKIFGTLNTGGPWTTGVVHPETHPNATRMIAVVRLPVFLVLYYYLISNKEENICWTVGAPVIYGNHRMLQIMEHGDGFTASGLSLDR
jgi:hypothetical protein